MHSRETIQPGPTAARFPKSMRTPFSGLPRYPTEPRQTCFEKEQRKWIDELIVGGTLGLLGGVVAAVDGACEAVLALLIGVAAGLFVGVVTVLLMGSGNWLAVGGFLGVVFRVSLGAGVLGAIGLILIDCAWIFHTLAIAYAVSRW